jgi:transposase-like protein
MVAKIDDQVRNEAVREYLRGAVTQERFCEAFEARTGCALSPRTLRSWISRYGAPCGVDGRGRALLAEALDRVRVLEAHLQAALDRLDDEAAAGVPDRQVDAEHEGLPKGAGSSVQVESVSMMAAPERAAAADQPLGIKRSPTGERSTAKGSFWDLD